VGWLSFRHLSCFTLGQAKFEYFCLGSWAMVKNLEQALPFCVHPSDSAKL